ncbi:hypothetical protein N0V83_005607 [Neocucurbitaria cava]|uniref:SWIM-type domain-containing protein n=1 Tax=Neocucurbitaria cava TaxID=798079 RepID=A0A9W8YA21_9PLEO|nr:hypothetical protein N0V83_005607 [Neocucurbitaria cava]
MPSAALPSSRHFVTQLLNSLPSLQQRTEGFADGSNLLSAVPDAVKKQLLSLQVLFPNEFVPALDLLDRQLVTRFHICNGNEQNVPQNEGAQNQQEHTKQPGDLHMEDQANSVTKATMRSEPPDARNDEQSLEHEPNDQAEDEIMVDAPTGGDDSAARHTSRNDHSTIYYVRSAQQRSSRYSTSYDTTTSYEVRLKAWNCSCPAFAFSAFPAIHPEPPVVATDELSDTADATTTERNTDQEQDAGWIFGGVSLGDGMPPVCKHLLACVLVEKCSGIFGSYVEERDVTVEEAAGWAAGWGD